MIRSFRDKDTEKFAGGESVRRFRSFERVAYRKIKYLMAAISLEDLRVPPGNRLEALSGTDWKHFPATGSASIPYESTTNGEYASYGATVRRRMWK